MPQVCRLTHSAACGCGIAGPLDAIGMYSIAGPLDAIGMCSIAGPLEAIVRENDHCQKSISKSVEF